MGFNVFSKLYWPGVHTFSFIYCCCYSVAQLCLNLCDPMNSSTLDFLSFTISQSLLKLMSIELVMPSNHHILYHSFLLLPSIYPSIRVFSNELVLQVRWPKYWSFSFSINLSNEYSALVSLGWTALISLLSKGLSRVFSSTTVWKHQCFGTQPYIWSNSHICTLLLEKPELWLCGLLSAKWYVCF